MSHRDLARIEAIDTVLEAFKLDSRYKVMYNNLSHCYELYLSSNNSLLAEFGNMKDKLVEPAFKNSFSEIERKISAQSDRLKYQV